MDDVINLDFVVQLDMKRSVLNVLMNCIATTDIF